MASTMSQHYLLDIVCLGLSFGLIPSSQIITRDMLVTLTMIQIAKCTPPPPRTHSSKQNQSPNHLVENQKVQPTTRAAKAVRTSKGTLPNGSANNFAVRIPSKNGIRTACAKPEIAVKRYGRRIIARADLMPGRVVFLQLSAFVCFDRRGAPAGVIFDAAF